jgi:transglutaminase-like putative cysteine protease
MGYRLGWLAGIAGIAFALTRAGRLLRSSIEGLPWQVVLVAAAALGAAITWAAVSYRLRARWIVLINVVAVALTVVRIAAPETTWFIFPTAASVEALTSELSFAREVISTGVAPVIPLSGIVAILATVFWALGALLAWGLLSERPYVAVLSPLVVYLEFAVMDRRPGGMWATAFMLMIGFALVAVALDQRRSGTGLLTSATTRRTLARSLPSLGALAVVVAVATALTASQAIAHMVPRSGYLDWRANTGLSGQYFGSVSYNPFVGIRQSLISSSNVPIFAAEVDGDLDGRSVYWRLLTLDSFDGAQWHVSGDARISPVDDVGPFESALTAFAGPTASVRATVTIAGLQMDWLPAPYSPVALASPTAAVERGLRIKEDDASLRFDALTYRGMTYTVLSQVPRPDLDVLRMGPDGTPSVVFAGAIAARDLPPAPASPTAERSLPDEDRFLRLPDRIDPGIGQLARRQVQGLETDFERALALETFFRETGGFRYSTDIAPGHGADDLAEWLNDASSNNYRVGYCEQFATAMAVMARTLGIPSRVVLGFTPGTLADDGRIVVRDRNAHAWVELWMPTQGWVQFDPTPRGDGVNPPTIDSLPFDVAQYLEVPAQVAPPIGTTSPGGPQIFLDEEDDVPVAPTGPGGGAEGAGFSGIPLWLVAVPLTVAVAFGSLPAVKWRRRTRRLRRLDDGDVAAAWSEIVDRLTDLGDPPPIAATPNEVASRATPALVPLASVYSEATYGASRTVAPDRLAAASRSLHDTEHQLTGRYSLGRRILSRYRLASVLPSAWRRGRPRGRSPWR